MIGIMINAVKLALQDTIQGEVSVKVSNFDVLYIKITVNNQPWMFSMQEITEQLHCGVTSTQIVEFCLKAYKRYIWGIYLKNS